MHYEMPTAGQKGVPLNPDHTHFLFVDDGSVGKFGVEITWRTEFEKYVSLTAGKEDSDETDEGSLNRQSM